MDSVLRQIYKISAIVIIMIFILPSMVLAVQQGDGVIIYGENTTATLRTRDFVDANTLFGSEGDAGTAASSIRHTQLKASPTRNEMIAGVQTTGGTLYIQRWNGSTWSDEWSVTVGDGNLARFDLSYERSSGDLMVVYSRNTGTTNEIGYRIWNGSTWTGETTYDAVRTSGVVQGITLASRGSGSDHMAMVWGDANFDLSANYWDGSSWQSEPSAALATNLSKIGTATELTNWSFDLEFESTSGELLVVWGIDATADPRYVTRGAGAGGAWSAVQTATALFEEPTDLDLSADPGSDYIAYINSTDNGNDSDAAMWTGSAWANATNFDTTNDTLVAGTTNNSIGWVTNGAQVRAVGTYDDNNGAGLDWITFNKNSGTWTVQTDCTTDCNSKPASGDDDIHRIRMNPHDGSELIWIGLDTGLDLWAKKLSFDGTNFTWTSLEPSGLALEDTLSTGTGVAADFAYNRYIPPTTTLGDGTDPGNSTIRPGAVATEIDRFSLVTSSGTDTVTGMTVTLGPANAFNNIATISVTSGRQGAFSALSQTSRNWRGMAVNYSTGDVYANDINNNIYKQTAGTGNFISLAQTSRAWYGVAVNSSTNDVYATVTGVDGNVYKQTAGSGSFVSLGLTAGSWGGVAVNSITGDVYVAQVGGDIYKQTAGTGNFVALGQTSRNWYAIGINENTGDVYAADANGDIYKQTAGTGNFVALGQTSRAWYALAVDSSTGDVYAPVVGGDIYKQTAGTGNFVAMGESSASRYSMAANSSTGDIYTTITSGDIYKASLTSYCSATPSSNTVALTSCGIGVTTSSAEFSVRITPKSHANMPAVPGASYATVATVTSITATNQTAGTDTDGATITVDNASPGSQASYDVVGVDASEDVFGVTYDDTHIYLVGYDSTEDLRIEKRSRSDGSLDGNFGTAGVVTGVSATTRGYSVENDGTYLYVTMTSSNNLGWRVEKRLMTTGALVDSFGTSGYVESAVASSIPFDIAIDSTYMYVVGYDDSSNARIEKRLLSTGALDNNFGTSGVVTGDAASEWFYGIQIDDTYLYAVGFDSGSNWRIEKRLLSTGALDNNFGTSGVVTGAAGSDWAYGIDIDSTYMYVVGQDSADLGRIEKRLLSTGALDNNFGTSGVVTTSAAVVYKEFWNIQIDDTYLYALGTHYVGAESLDSYIEKRLLSTGALDNNFGTSGVLQYSDSTKSATYWGFVDSGVLYTVGSSAEDPGYSPWFAGKKIFTSNGSFAPAVGVTAGNAQVSLSWTNPADSDLSRVMVVASTTAITFTPVEGTTYATSTLAGDSRVACYGLQSSCIDTGLTNGTGYYYKIFNLDSRGNWSAGQLVFERPITPKTFPTVTTDSPTVATSITQTTATLNGNISSTGGASVTTRGFAYGTTAGLTTGVSTTTENGTFSAGAFTTDISSLTCGTTYYVRAYAVNSVGTSLGSIVSFVTSACATAPTVTTDVEESITQTTVTLNGSVSNNGGADATQHGFAWSTSSTLTSGVSTTTGGAFSGTGSFTSGTARNLTGLTCNTTYYYRAYATNSGGTGYGTIEELTTSQCIPTVSGTVYSDDGSTVLTTTPTVRIKVNGAGDYSTAANGSGVYSIPNVTLVAGDVVTVYLDGATEKAVTVTKAANDTSNITGLNLYQNRVIVRHEDAGPTTNTNLDQYDSGNDADIQFTVTTGALSVASGNKLIVWTGDTFTPGGTVLTTASGTAGNPDGDVLIQSGATLSMGTNALTVGGDFTNSGTFSYSGGQTTTFTATATGHGIEDGTANFDTLVFNGSGGGWLLLSNVTTVGNLTITAGNLTVNTTDLTVGGSTSISGTLTISSSTGTKNFSGDVTVNAGGTWNNSGNEAIGLAGNLTNNQTFTAGSGVYTMSGNSKTISGTISIPNLTVSGTVTNNGTLTVATALSGAGTLTNGTTAILSLGGTFGITNLIAEASNNLVNYTGSSPAIRSITYDNLTFSGSGIATIGGSTIVNATMTVSGIVANNSTLTVNGALNGASTLSNSATGTLNIGFSSAPGITTLTATASGNIVNYTAANPNCKVTTYNILNFTGSGTVTCAVTTVTNDINLSGTVSWTTTSSINLTDTLTVGNGTALVNGAYTLTAPNVTVTGTGTLTNNGTLTVSTALGGTGTVTNGASGTLNIGQSTVPMASGTLTASASGNIVNYTAANPNCKVVTYYALNFTGTGTVTCAVTSLYSTTLSGDVSWTTSSDIAASIVNVTVAAALINAEGFTLTTQLAQADGLGIDNYGTLTIGLTVIGTVLQNRSTGILNIGFTGEPIVSSIIATASGNTVNYTGSSPSIKPTTYHHLTINGSGTAIIGGSTTVNGTLTVTSALTNGSTLTVTGALEGASTLTNNSSGVLNIGFASTPGITTLTATASGNTVNYTAASPNCKVTTYHHLNFTGSGTVTCAVTTVNGNLATSGTVSWTTGANLAVGGALTVGNGTTLTQGSYTLSVSGNTTIGAGSTGVFVGSGNGLTLNGNLTLNSGATWTKGAGTVTFSKGAAQVITDSTASSQDLGNVVTSTASTAVSTASNIKLTSLNIAGSTSWDISNHTMTVTGTSNPLTISGTFTTTGSTVDFTGNGASPIPATTYNNLGLKPSGASQQVLGSGTFTIDGTFTVGDGVNAGATAAINNPVININGFGSVINSGAIFTHGNGAFNIKSFQVDGTFSGSGTGNILFDGGLNGSGTVTLTGADIEILHSLGCNGSGLQINGSNNWTIKKVTFSNGTGCDANIQLNTGFMGATLTVTDQLLIGKTGNSNMVTVAPSGTIILTSTGTPLVILSSPEARLNGDNATFRFIGNGATITSTPTGNPPFVMGSSYGNLELKPSGSTSQVLAAGTFTVNGSLIVGNGIHSGGADASINDPIINITSTLDIASNSTFTTGDGDMTISGGTNGGLVGTLSGSGTGTISINGNSNFYGEGIVNLTGGTFEFRPSGQKSFGTISGSSDWIFNNLTFGNSSEFGSLSIIVLEGGTGTITVNGNLLVGKSGDSHDTTLDAGNRTWILTNTGTPFVLLTGLGGNGVFDDDTSTFRFTGNGATIPALTYNNLELKPNGASPQVIGTGGLQTLGVVGNLTIGDGTNAGATASANNPTINVTGDTTIASGATLVSTSGNLTVGGNFTNNGTFTHNSGTVRFEGASKTASGNMIGTSAFNNLTLINAGSRAFNNNASTTNLTISSGTLTAPNLLSIAGNYSNSGTFSHNNGTTTFNGIVDQTLTGNMIGTSAFRNLEILNNTLTATTTFANNASTTANFYVPVSNARIEFAPSATTTLTNLIVNGQSEGNEVRLWSATPGSWWGLDVPGTRSISYMSVMDSRACSGNPNIIANVTILNAGNNSCWDFPTGGAPTISSAGNQVFTNGASATTISTITITDDTIPGITADNDLRIGIATSSVDMLWLTSDTTATLGGTASGKVSTTVSYEGGGSVLVIPVNTNFASGDTLTISGLSFISFGDANAATPALGVYTEGPGDITADAMDDKTVMIKGRMTLADHDAGQELNKFQITTTSVTGSELFAFKLSPFGENFSITNFVYTLIGIKGLNTGDFANVLMNIDYDGDGSITAGETQVGGEGVVNINGRTGTITFADDFTATTTRNYVLRADVSGIIPGDHLNVGLNTAGITTSGTVALQPTTVTGAIETVNHTRITYGTDVGGGVAGAGIVTGGGVGPGETIGDDPLLLRPTSTGSTQNQWTTPTNAYDGVNGTYATETAAQDSQDYGTFSFSVPAGNIIDGIEVKIEANGSQNAGTIDVALSWNGGTNVTSVKSTATLSATDTVYTLGGGSDKWGRTWSSSDFSNANFRLRITGQPSGNTISVDDIKVKVYHRASGGGSGGGGDIGYKSKPRSVANVFSVFEYLWNLFK